MRNSEGAVVKTEEVRIEQLPNKWWSRKIRFQIATGMFSIRMPEQFTELFPNHPVPRGKTVALAEVKWKEALALWGTSTTNMEKVILFRFPMRCVRGEELDRRDLDMDDNQDVHAAGLGFMWTLAWKRTVGSQESNYYELDKDGNPDLRSRVSHHVLPGKKEITKSYSSNRYVYEESRGIEVPYTPEREAFMANMTKSLDSLIDRALEFEKAVSTTDGLDLRVAGQGLLLLGPSEIK